MVDVAFAIDPDLAIVAVQFKRTSVMLGVGLFVGNDDRGASTIGLEVDAEKGSVVGIDDTKDTAVPNGLKHLNLGANAVKNQNVYARDVLGL